MAGQRPWSERGVVAGIPLTFLDTNVLQALESFGEFIYDGYLAPEKDAQLQHRGPRFERDIEGLAAWVDLARPSGWPVTLSGSVIDELGQTYNPIRRAGLLRWASEMFNYSMEIGCPALDTFARLPIGIRDYIERSFFQYLPHLGDPYLLRDALAQQVDVFLTMDYRSIRIHRDSIWKEARIEVLTPSELVDVVLRPTQL